jgi:hypothetical protein
LKEAGCEVMNVGKRANTILTTSGEAELKKTRLRIKTVDKITRESKTVEVIVMDDYFKLNQMPHRMTNGLMGKICWWAQHEHSYESAQNIMRDELNINVSDEYMRTITMEVGKLIFDDDTRKAADIDQLNAETPLKWTIDGTLYTNKKRLCRI